MAWMSQDARRQRARQSPGVELPSSREDKSSESVFTYSKEDPVFTLYADILYLLATFVCVAVAAIIGLWQYNATPEAIAVRPIVLSDDVRADIMRARNKALQDALDAKRTRKAEYRRSMKASTPSAKSDGTVEAMETNRASSPDAQSLTRQSNPKAPGPATS
jgi:hypothetical protein